MDSEVEKLQKILGIDKKSKIVFNKTNFSPEKIGVRPVFDRMFTNANFRSEIARINNDIKSSFTNLMKIGVQKEEIPVLSASLFNNLMVTIDRGNLELLKDDTAPEFTRKELRKISETQNKIYKILFKIEEDLIDEQDTSIKNKDSNFNEFKKLLDLYKKNIEKRLKEIEKNQGSGNGNGNGNDDGSSILDTILNTALGLGGAGGASWLFRNVWNRIKNRTKIKAMKERISKAEKVAKERAKRAKEAEKAKKEAERQAKKQKTEEAKQRAEEAKRKADAEKAKKVKSDQHLEDLKNKQKELKTGKPQSSGSKVKPKAPKPPKPPKGTSGIRKVFAKMAEKLGPFLKTAGKVAGTVFAAIEVFFVLPKSIYDFWEFSNEHYKHFGPLERFVYSATAGLTQWTEDFFMSIPDIGKMISEMLDTLISNWEEIDESDNAFTQAFKPLMTFSLVAIKAVVEKLLVDLVTGIVKIFKKVTGAKTGDACGLEAVSILRENWSVVAEFVSNLMPNDTTYELLMGENKILADLQRKGIYTWNVVGHSTLNRFQFKHEIAEKLTTSEINEILKHNDVDDSTKTLLEGALKYKEEHHITDEKVQSNYNNEYLDELLERLRGKDTFGTYWHDFIDSVRFQTEAFVLASGFIGIKFNRKTKQITHLKTGLSNNFGDRETPGWFRNKTITETMFALLFEKFKSKANWLGLSQIDSIDEYLYFTVFGSLISVHNQKKKETFLNYDPNEVLCTQILGYIDSDYGYHPDKVNPKDIIVKALIDGGARKKFVTISNKNLIFDKTLTSSNSETKEISSSLVDGVLKSSLPSHLAMTQSSYTDDSGNSNNYESNSLGSENIPSYVPGIGLQANTQSLSSTDVPEIPTLNTPSYTGTDYTSIEAIKKAKIFQRNGKWFSDNPFIDAVIQIESKRNANARPWSRAKQKYLSSAAGLFQFIESTGKTFGLNTLQDRLDPMKSFEAFKNYVFSNINSLRKNGIPVTPANVYLCHQQGAGGFCKIYNFITGKARSVSSELVNNMAGNTHGHKFTSPQAWYTNWANDIAKLMGSSANIPSLSQVPSYVPGSGTESASFSADSSSSAPDMSGFSAPYSPEGYKEHLAESSSAGSIPSYVPSSQGSETNTGSIPSYVPSSQGSETGMGNPMLNAMRYAKKHAKKKSSGYCARYVANALEYAGIKFQRQPSAYMYHTNGILKKAGFGLVSTSMSGYSPQPGDVCVIGRFNNHKHGHICIYDGKNWISDFVQRTPSPYRDGPGPLYFYRYGGPDVAIDTQMENYDSSESWSPVETPPQDQQDVTSDFGLNISKPSVMEGATEGIFSFAIEECF